MSDRREYQDHAVRSVRAQWRAGKSSVLLIGPTGCGKTEMGIACLDPSERVLWVVHRRDLALQTADRLASSLGRGSVGIVTAGEHLQPKARVQVATIQSYLRRAVRLRAANWTPMVLVLDEAHHYVADDWRGVIALHPHARTLGMTATPERQDGRPLGDIFRAHVVAAGYQELIAAGFLVDADVVRPDRALGSDIAMDPVDAWLKFGRRKPGFVFCARVAIAKRAQRAFAAAGVRAAVVTAETAKKTRDRVLDEFRRGQVRMIVNVHTMTEGVDLPEATVCILARRFDHAGAMLQATGRVLRTHRSKARAIVIDLAGSTHVHGLPTEDREYSLDGRGIGGGEPREAPAERSEFVQEVLGLPMHWVGDANTREPDTTERPSRTRLRRRSAVEILDGVASRVGA